MSGIGPLAACLAAALDCFPSPETAGRVGVPDRPGVYKTSASERAGRRAFDGAPPVIPHDTYASTCTECHNREGVALRGVGFAPPSPHVETAGLSRISRCQQCHVYRQTESSWRESSYRGLRQDLRQGRRAGELAPPVLPHPVFMRENCIACHSGPAAREEIRTEHPERVRCRQCHVEQRGTTRFPVGATEKEGP